MRGLLVIVLVASIFSATSAFPTWGDIAKAWEDAKDKIQAGYDEHIDPLVDKAKEAWDQHVDPILEALKQKARNFIRERKDDFSDFSDKLKAQSDQMAKCKECAQDDNCPDATVDECERDLLIAYKAFGFADCLHEDDKTFNDCVEEVRKSEEEELGSQESEEKDDNKEEEQDSVPAQPHVPAQQEEPVPAQQEEPVPAKEGEPVPAQQQEIAPETPAKRVLSEKEMDIKAKRLLSQLLKGMH